MRLAIDDFGTGQSSLARLHRFSLDLKIDRSFTAACGVRLHAADAPVATMPAGVSFEEAAAVCDGSWRSPA